MKTRGFEIVSKYQDRGIELPQRKTAASAGYDLQAARTVVIEPGHDAWTVGSQPCVLYDLAVGDHGGHLA